MAVRTAISRVRVAVRASSRFATFVHATSRISVTAPSMVSRIVVVSEPMSVNDRTFAPRSSLVSGYSAASRPAIALISACAASRPTPSRSRP